MTSDQSFWKELTFWVPQFEAKEGEKKKRNTTEEMLRKEEKEQCMVMYEHVTCKNKSIVDKNPIQTTTLTLIN